METGGEGRGRREEFTELVAVDLDPVGLDKVKVASGNSSDAHLSALRSKKAG